MRVGAPASGRVGTPAARDCPAGGPTLEMTGAWQRQEGWSKLEIREVREK